MIQTGTGSRRDFLKTAALIAGAGQVIAAPKKAEFIDVNVTLSRWPGRRVHGDTTSQLATLLRSHGVTQAWASTFDGLLHKDVAAANARLASECRKSGRGIFTPFGVINPTLPEWREDLRRCAEVHRMPGIRLYPNYHGYTLASPIFQELLEAACARKVIIQLAAILEDERMMHASFKAAPVDVGPLAELLPKFPTARILLLNAMRSIRLDQLSRLMRIGQVYAELATLEGIGGVASALQQMSPGRLLFGSHAPFFYFEAAVLKLRESGLYDAGAARIKTAAADLLH